MVSFGGNSRWSDLCQADSNVNDWIVPVRSAVPLAAAAAATRRGRCQGCIHSPASLAMGNDNLPPMALPSPVAARISLAHPPPAQP